MTDNRLSKYFFWIPFRHKNVMSLTLLYFSSVYKKKEQVEEKEGKKSDKNVNELDSHFIRK